MSIEADGVVQKGFGMLLVPWIDSELVTTILHNLKVWMP